MNVTIESIAASTTAIVRDELTAFRGGLDDLGGFVQGCIKATYAKALEHGHEGFTEAEMTYIENAVRESAREAFSTW